MMPGLNFYWILNIGLGVLLGLLTLMALGVLVFVVGPWVHDKVRSWRRRA